MIASAGATRNLRIYIVAREIDLASGGRRQQLEVDVALEWIAAVIVFGGIQIVRCGNLDRIDRVDCGIDHRKRDARIAQRVDRVFNRILNDSSFFVRRFSGIDGGKAAPDPNHILTSGMSCCGLRDLFQRAKRHCQTFRRSRTGFSTLDKAVGQIRYMFYQCRKNRLPIARVVLQYAKFCIAGDQQRSRLRKHRRLRLQVFFQ